MKSPFLFLALVFAALVIGAFIFKNKTGPTDFMPQVSKKITEKPFDKYAIENLSKIDIQASNVEIGDLITDGQNFTSYVFYFYVNGKKVSGLLNVPKGEGIFSVIVMFRGYVDREIYTTGIGTARAGGVFAQTGFVNLSPDLLGYGQSDNPSENAMEERFQTYMTALTLLASVENLNATLESLNIDVRVDHQKVGIWGHSNGGQIVLTILEATGKTYPTVLWAPVSKPFPYSILYYTDDFDDHGKMLRRVVSDFEKDYDAERYSLTNFFDRINAPIQLHQGAADDAVPLRWSNELVDQLEKLDKNVEYFTYGGDDHNFANGSWQTVVERNIAFFRENL